MRPELERLRFIEQQLLSGPAALSAEDWKLRLLLDGDLHADAAAQQHLYQGLRLAGRRQLRRELTGIHNRLCGPRPGFWYRLNAWLRPLFPS